MISENILKKICAGSCTFHTMLFKQEKQKHHCMKEEMPHKIKGDTIKMVRKTCLQGISTKNSCKWLD